MQPGIEDDIFEDAAAWAVRLRADPSADDVERFNTWRSQSPSHARAYEDALLAWGVVGQHATSPQMLTLRRDALDRARRPATGNSWWNRRAMLAALVVLLIVPAALLSWQMLRMRTSHEFQTARGEQRVIVLEDGSRMSLDAMSQVEVNYTSDVRGIRLIAGRANFEVVKDVTRPLKVHAGPRTVTAIGTVFTVERVSPFPGSPSRGWNGGESEVLVGLVEGRVAVTDTDKAGKAVEMHARQQLRVTDGGKVTLRDGLDSAQMLAWRDGKLIFDNEPLGAVVERINNYAMTPILVTGPARDLRVSGVFRAGDTSSFIDAMESYFDLAAVRREDSIALQVK